MHLFLDESGNTGLDLLNYEQPIFALASTNLSAEQCRELLSPLLRQNQTEAKYSRLKGKKAGQQALVNLFSSSELGVATAKVAMVDKRYYLISHLVDKLIEPPLHDAGVDLYAGDAHVGLVNVWHYAGHYIFPNGWWKKVLRSFLQAIRQKNGSSYASFDSVLGRAMASVPHEYRDFATGLILARGRLDEFIGGYVDVEVFDPAVDMFIDVINKWTANNNDWLAVTHDRSKPLRRSESYLRSLMTPVAPRIIGYGDRQCKLPLQVSNLEFGDSETHPQLQISDLIAGASIDCLLAWSGQRQRTEYHDAMRETRLDELFTGGMLPSPELKRKNEPREGEVSLVDGAATFMKEIRYFSAL